MPRPKSLTLSMEITTVIRAHDCRFNGDHRLEKGMRRLTIKEDGEQHHYCLACARVFAMNALQRLQVLLAEIEGSSGTSS